MDDPKTVWWDHMLEVVRARRRPCEFTEARLRRVKIVVWADRWFWQDILKRHGADRLTPDQMRAQSPEWYEHCVGNMIGMTLEIMLERGIVRSSRRR